MIGRECWLPDEKQLDTADSITQSSLDGRSLAFSSAMPGCCLVAR
jgi:hypothetical protein